MLETASASKPDRVSSPRKRRGRARAGGVVDDADGERVPRSGPAPGKQDQHCEESASTNGAVLTESPRLKRTAASQAGARAYATVQAAVEDLQR